MSKSNETSVGRAPLKSVKKHTPNPRSHKPLSRKKIKKHMIPIQSVTKRISKPSHETGFKRTIDYMIPKTKGNTKGISKPSYETGFTSSKKENSI